MIISVFETYDYIALGLFIATWSLFEVITDFSGYKWNSLEALMARQRRSWMLEMAERDLRMIDTQIIQSLQNGAAFFGSATIFAIGGCFALLGATEEIMQLYKDLRVPIEITRQLFEIKVFGLTFIFVYSFFKFAWSYRLFNYCSILVGGVPMLDHGDKQTRKRAGIVAAEMNISAGRHFTAGLRGIFFALAFLGWFVSPLALLATTIFVVLVLLRRNYFSKARKILLELEREQNLSS